MKIKLVLCHKGFILGTCGHLPVVQSGSTKAPGRMSKKAQPRTKKLIRKPVFLKTWGCVR